MRIKCVSFCLLLMVIWFAPCLEAGESSVEIKIIVNQMIEMRDGVKLSARIWMPEKITEPLPTIFVLTPYISDESQKRGMFFARNGYVYTSVDVRGRGNSDGIFFPLEGDKHSLDIYDIVTWIEKQPWSDGRVVMRGGSYRGMVQWQAMKTRPKGLVSIVPSDPVHPGIDFPFRLNTNIYTPYTAHWLALTGGVTGNDALFEDMGYWLSKYLKQYREHIPAFQYWKTAGIEERIYKRWLAHPTFDEFWQSCSPTPEDYKEINIPILTITGHFAGDQLGGRTYYKNFMKYASKEAKEKHYLVLGPWSHSGTRYPEQELYGQKFGKNAVPDMDRLHLEWYDWHLKGKKPPDLIKDRVCYYVMGSNQWKYAPGLEAVSNAQQVWYLSSENSRANDVFHSGKLSTKTPGNEKPDRFVYDPLDNTAANRLLEQGINFEYLNDLFLIVDQTDAYSMENLIYHTPPLEKDVEIAGFITFNAYISLNVPDTDLLVTIYEIKPDGTAVWLTCTVMRARYRDSLTKPEPVKPGEINLYKFDTFDFFSRVVTKDSRLRLVFGAQKNPFSGKNYNSGGEVTKETAKDARKAVITLHHDKKYPSHLVIPFYNTANDNE